MLTSWTAPPPITRYDAPALTADDFSHAAHVAARTISVCDLLDELIDAEDALREAIAANDAAKIGRIVLAVRAHYADRLGHRDLTGHGLPFQTADVARRA